MALAVSLDGTLRTANRRITEILRVPYSDLMNHKLEDFLGAPLIAEEAFDLSRFLEKRPWAGVVAVQLKDSPKRFYYDCVASAIVKGDDVTGASVLARNVTGQREKEQRFTQLFEILREGVYICSPEGKLLEVNPALASILGYPNKEELLNLPPDALKVDADAEPVLGRAASSSGNTRTREVRLRRKDGGVAVCHDTSSGVTGGRANRALPGHAGGRHRDVSSGTPVTQPGRIPAPPAGKFSRPDCRTGPEQQVHLRQSADS